MFFLIYITPIQQWADVHALATPSCSVFFELKNAMRSREHRMVPAAGSRKIGDGASSHLLQRGKFRQNAGLKESFLPHSKYIVNVFSPVSRRDEVITVRPIGGYS